MKKITRLFSTLLSFSVAVSVIHLTIPNELARAATVTKNTKKKKSPKSSTAQNSTEGSGLPTKLPPYKGPKRVKVNFDRGTEMENPSVVVRTDLPLEQAAEDHTQAQNNFKKSSPIKIQTSTLHVSSAPVTLAEVTEDDALAQENSQEQNPPQLATMATTLPEKAPAKKKAAIPLAAATTPMPMPTPTQITQPEIKASSQPTITVVRATPTPTPIPTPFMTSAAPLFSAKANDTSRPEPLMMTRKTETMVPIRSEFDQDRKSNTQANVPAPIATPSEPAPAFSSLPALRLDKNRFYLRASYLDAHYNRLEDRLQNGASSMGFALSREMDRFEPRIAFDITHGLDQALTAQNIRMMTLRGDMAFYLTDGTVKPFVSGGAGLVDYNVRSYRSTSGSSFTIKEHAKGIALALIPGTGVRVETGHETSFDLHLEYLTLLTSSDASALGGLSLGTSIGFAF